MMTHDEFVEKECHSCGSQRCYGVDYCGKYKEEVLGIEDEFTKAYKDCVAKHTTDDDYDPYTGKYAFVSPNDEADEGIHGLKEMLRDAKDALLYMLVLHDSTHSHNMREAVQILYHLQSDNRWNVQKAKEALKKISDYLEQEE